MIDENLANYALMKLCCISDILNTVDPDNEIASSIRILIRDVESEFMDAGLVPDENILPNIKSREKQEGDEG